ncbi:hypothetical protein GQ53DRAFT_499276 [Thozetella sp. PMI_491]|nr:hypothetical protein GQ53DRAFT_499276 [Thozetella sp. PMI_491]
MIVATFMRRLECQSNPRSCFSRFSRFFRFFSLSSLFSHEPPSATVVPSRLHCPPRGNSLVRPLQQEGRNQLRCRAEHTTPARCFAPARPPEECATRPSAPRFAQYRTPSTKCYLTLQSGGGGDTPFLGNEWVCRHYANAPARFSSQNAQVNRPWLTGDQRDREQEEEERPAPLFGWKARGAFSGNLRALSGRELPIYTPASRFASPACD